MRLDVHGDRDCRCAASRQSVCLLAVGEGGGSPPRGTAAGATRGRPLVPSRRLRGCGGGAAAWPRAAAAPAPDGWVLLWRWVCGGSWGCECPFDTCWRPYHKKETPTRGTVSAWASEVQYPCAAEEDHVVNTKANWLCPRHQETLDHGVARFYLLHAPLALDLPRRDVVREQRQVHLVQQPIL